MGKNVEIDIEEIKRIATQTMTQIQQGAHEDSTHFRNTKLTDSAFGGIHEGVEFGNQAQAAQQAFHKVINEVIKELESFGHNLKASADAHEDNDQAVESTMAAMNGRYGRDHRWSSTRTLANEGRKHKDLKVPADGAVQSQDQGTSAGGPNVSDDGPDNTPSNATTGSDAGSPASDASVPTGGGMGGNQPTGPGTP